MGHADQQTPDAQTPGDSEPNKRLCPAQGETNRAGAGTTPGKQHAGQTSGSNGETENVAIFPLAISMLAGLAAFMAVMVLTGKIMVLAAIADRMIDPRLSNVFSRVTTIILTALSVQFVIDGLTALQPIAVL